MAASKSMELSRELTQMHADQLRNLTSTLLAELAERDAQISKQHAELSARSAVIASRAQVIANRDQELKHKLAAINNADPNASLRNVPNNMLVGILLSSPHHCYSCGAW